MPLAYVYGDLRGPKRKEMIEKQLGEDIIAMRK